VRIVAREVAHGGARALRDAEEGCYENVFFRRDAEEGLLAEQLSYGSSEVISEAGQRFAALAIKGCTEENGARLHSIQEDRRSSQATRKGSIQKAYRTALLYDGSATHFKNSYRGCEVSGLYQGYLDMNVLALFHVAQQRDLKIAIVFNYTHSDRSLARRKQPQVQRSTGAV